MTDLLGPSFLRPTDSWSCTEVRSSKHSHVWTVKGFSQCDCRYLETSLKPLSNDSSLIYRIRLHPQGNKESNKDFTFFQVFCNTSNTRYKGKFTVYNSRNEEIATTVYMGQQQLHGYFEYIRRDLLINHLAPSDELQLLLELTLTFDTVTKSCLSKPPQVESRASDYVYNSRRATPSKFILFYQKVSRDFEIFLRDTKHTDFTIYAAGDKPLTSHKAVLIARSPVFAAMLEPHTEESKNCSVKFDDIDSDILSEVLMYIYSGKSPNLKDMAADLLPVADRFALTGLKDMAEQILKVALSIDNVCRILLLADMHGARELKQDAMSFVAQNSSLVIQVSNFSRKFLHEFPGNSEQIVM
uniref:Uncharacterized protein n=1 Tax=Romanomermis culicivorax TaxID=13658 RepID=A0A915JFA4_ROMCU